jgi:hypothetical protein
MNFAVAFFVVVVVVVAGKAACFVPPQFCFERSAPDLWYA